MTAKHPYTELHPTRDRAVSDRRPYNQETQSRACLPDQPGNSRRNPQIGLLFVLINRLFTRLATI